MVSLLFFFHFSITFFSAVPDEMITRLFAAFASLKQKIVFKFDSIKVSNVTFPYSLFARKTSVTMPKKGRQEGVYTGKQE
jgi:hypothetical protein